MGRRGVRRQRHPLLDALAGLREQGYQIIYSDDLVTTSQRIDVAAIDLDNVQAALGRIGLTLSRRGDIWLVVRNQDVPPSLTLHVVSTSGEVIAAAEFQFGRKGERTYVNGANGRFLVTWPANTVDAITIRARDHYPRTLPLSEIDGTIVLPAHRTDRKCDRNGIAAPRAGDDRTWIGHLDHGR